MLIAENSHVGMQELGANRIGRVHQSHSGAFAQHTDIYLFWKHNQKQHAGSVNGFGNMLILITDSYTNSYLQNEVSNRQHNGVTAYQRANEVQSPILVLRSELAFFRSHAVPISEFVESRPVRLPE